MRLATMVLFAMAFGGVGCAAGAGGGPAASGDGTGGSEPATTGAGGEADDGAGGTGGFTLTGGAGTGGVATGNETVCDGIDNDQNGVVDDVDKGKDGVCDCLRLATLGVKGKYGQGDVFAEWLNSRSDFGAVPLVGQELTPALLGQYEVIVAQDLSAGFGSGSFSSAEILAMKAWVESGGGLMTLIGYEDEYSINNVNTLLQPMGMSYGSQKILYDAAVTGWLPHPVTNGVSLIHIGNGYPVQGPGTMVAHESGYNVLQVSTVGSGRVLMWADEWITYDTEWTQHPEYQVELFWLNVIKWLTPPDICQVPTVPELD
jgi:hypothetical protein